jgi:hypothetical protein
MTHQTEPATITDPKWLQQQYAAVIRRWWDTDDGGAEEIAAAVLAVRDRHLDQLRQRLTLADITLNADAAEQLRLTDAMRQQNLDSAAAAIQRADAAEEFARRALAQRQEMAEERYAWQERGDRAETALARVRDLAADLERAGWTGPAIARRIRQALDEPSGPAATQATDTPSWPHAGTRDRSIPDHQVDEESGPA